MKINSIEGFEVIDSRGNPTVEVDIITDEGVLGLSLIHISEPTRPY